MGNKMIQMLWFFVFQAKWNQY